MDTLDKSQVIPVDYLKVGMVLNGPLYDVKGSFLWPARTPIRSDFIENLKRLGISELTYRPISYETVFSKEKVENPMIPQHIVEKVHEGISYVIWDITNNVAPRVDRIKPSIEEVAKEIRISSSGKMLNLLDLKGYDSYTYTHSINVSFLAIYIGTKFGLSIDKINSLGLGGLLIDIGKIKIPKSILEKTTPLSTMEIEIIRKHPLLGYQLIKDNKDLDETSKRVVLLHHEKLNGSGYPLGLDSSRIDQFVRIVTICDVFDAMITEKPYRPPLPIRVALEEILRKVNSEYDSEIVLRFSMEICKMYKIDPPIEIGTVVRLSSEEVAIVTSKHDKYDMKPVVSIVFDNQMNLVRSPITIDLIKDPAGRRIKEIIFEFDIISKTREFAVQKGILS